MQWGAMRLKLLGNYWNPTFVLLWTVESAAVLCASRIAPQVLAPYSAVAGWAQSWVFVVLVLFAMARTVGWIAHASEQLQHGRLIRPRARYIGPAPGRSPAFSRPRGM